MGAVIDELLYRTRLKRRPPAFQRSRADVLQTLPMRNALVEWRKEETGEVSLIIPADQKRHLRFLIRLMRLPDKRVVALDAVGSFVWERCDGEHTFGQIAEALAEEFGMTRREAEASLAEFFRVLGRRGMLGFAVPKEAAKRRMNASKSSKRSKSAPTRKASSKRKKG